MISGFLLTRHWQDTVQGIRLDFWLSSSEGPLQVSIHQQKAIFFISQNDVSRAEQLLAGWDGVAIRPLELKTFKFEAVSGVYFDTQQQLYRARDLFAQHQLPAYEADIRPADRYLN